MAKHALAANFGYFFRRLNPSPSFEQRAASEHKTITGLIENPYGLASALSPKCFLQGSYRQQTAIYTINDVDIVTLCELWQPGSALGLGPSWDRNTIFDTIAAPLLKDGRYKDKVRYNQGSMCIKVDLSIKIEILPVVYKATNYDLQKEPFRLYRPQRGQWEDGYARYHQRWLTWKNAHDKAKENFKPAIKVFKHLRSRDSLDAVSFHIECLMFSLPDYLYWGSPADYITALLNHIASKSALDWYINSLNTPCTERNIFDALEWGFAKWELFHKKVIWWSVLANIASNASDREDAIKWWQLLLGESFSRSKYLYEAHPLDRWRRYQRCIPRLIPHHNRRFSRPAFPI